MSEVRVFAIGSVAVALLAAAACEPWDPAPRTQSFPLVNAHADVTCEGCHPYEPPFTAEVGTCEGIALLPADPLAGCLSCHECDRPEAHYEGVSCGQAGCHAEVQAGWAPDGFVPGGTNVQTCAGVCHNPFAPLREDAAPASDAHTAHLDGDTISALQIGCDECHGPDFGGDGHESDGLLVTFGAFTTANGALAPAYDPTAKTCAGTYCHGGAMTTPLAEPAWDDDAYDVASCEPCHGFPPPPPHPGLDSCDACHGTGSSAADIDKALHLDGTCEGC